MSVAFISATRVGSVFEEELERKRPKDRGVTIFVRKNNEPSNRVGIKYLLVDDLCSIPCNLVAGRHVFKKWGAPQNELSNFHLTVKCSEGRTCIISRDQCR